MSYKFENTIDFARRLDEEDELSSFRSRFLFPKDDMGKDKIYFTGNSLGLQPKKTEEYLNQELKDWANYGVEGHFEAKRPWFPYHEIVTESLAKLCGAKSVEVAAMNTLTVNLHLLMVSFYRPKGKKKKIVIEKGAFPSDVYAVKSQIKFHGGDPDEDLIMLSPNPGEEILETEKIVEIIEENADEIALIMMGGVNYYTGQFFDMKTITETAHKCDIICGWDLAHAMGNVKLQLHDWGVDFAAWCSYKYLNSGPGGIAGIFINDKYADKMLPRFEGWWGQNKQTRFDMEDEFDPIYGAEAWQLSNPPIFQLAAHRASLDIFDEVGIDKLTKKSKKLTSYLEYLVKSIDTDKIEIITPKDVNQRGCQLSIQVKDFNRQLNKDLTTDGVVSDWREPDVIRIAPVPLYNRFIDCYEFTKILEKRLKTD